MRTPRPLPRHSSERGAAVLEMAVSLTLIVSLLLITIYVGEAFLAGAKAQEAEISAGWDLTAYRMHDYSKDGTHDYEGGPTSLYGRATTLVAGRVKRDLSGLNSYVPGAREGQRFVLSEQRLEEDGLVCAPYNAENLGKEIGASLLTFDGLPHNAWKYLHRGGYVNCRAKVHFTSPYMPRELRDGYASRVNLLSNKVKNGFNLCGLGSTLQGCEGNLTSGFVVLTNDWGLEDGRENAVGTRDNARYFRVGESVFLMDEDYNKDKEGHVVLRPGEGGIGGQQVREAMTFLLDTEDDYGDTSLFKFGFLNSSNRQRSLPVDPRGGQTEAHLTPWDDGEERVFTNATRNIALGQRRDHTYLGHPDARFNQP